MARVRVRFAPSPTGFMHLGSLRTALYDYLYAKANDGDFILRIEDTDRARYIEGSVEDIINTIKWSGMKINEGPEIGGDYGPYIQSERKEIYQKYIQELIDKGYAYKCFCTPERLEEMRELQKSQKQTTIGYDRLCRNLTPDEIKAKEKDELPYVVRFKMPIEGETIIEDKIRGRIVVENSNFQDQVLLKSDGFPTYHLAAVVDDHLMEISHIFRGEEWINSTPLHFLLYKAFGWQPPVFVHLPVILSATGKGKMGKRDGATMVKDYIEKGYLSDALVNFLVNLGWALDDKTDTYSLSELEKVFSIEGIGKSAPRFQIDKLNHYNQYYIRKLSLEEFINKAKPFLKQNNLNYDKMLDNDKEILKEALSLVQERITTFPEIYDWINFLFKKEVEYKNPKDLIQKKMDKEKASNLLSELVKVIENTDKFEKTVLEEEIKNLYERMVLKSRPFFMTIRVAITGSPISLPLYESMVMLGKEKTLGNIQKSIQTIEKL